MNRMQGNEKKLETFETHFKSLYKTNCQLFSNPRKINFE